MSAMFKKSGTAALIGLLAVAPIGAFAQTATEEPTTEESTMPQDGTATDGTATIEGGDVAAEGGGEAPQAEPPKPVEGQIIMQSENTVLADDLMGSSVYSQSGESIGDIDDMIVNLDGSIEGIVIGVGGFLGIGEKSVAIEMSSLSTQMDENGNVQLITSASREDLEAAEAFVTASQQQAMQQNQEAAESQAEGATGENTGMSGDGTGMTTEGGAATEEPATEEPAAEEAEPMTETEESEETQSQ